MIIFNEVKNMDGLMNKESETNGSEDMYVEDKIMISKSILRL